MRAKVALGIAAVMVAAALSGCLVTTSSHTATIAAPDAGVVGFGSALSMDEGRLVARAVRAGSPVVYVFDSVGSGWVHSATITAPPPASESWGSFVAVSGDTIAVADPGRSTGPTEQYGMVTIYDRREGTWQSGQTLTSDREWTNFAAGVWLTGDGLVVRSDRVCDSVCSVGQWDLYQRYGTQFRAAFTSRPERTGIGLSVGVDQGRIALGNPGFHDIDLGVYDNALLVVDANVRLPSIVLDETVPVGDPFGTEPIIVDQFRKVDLSGDLLAYENCCGVDRKLRIRRFDGSTYQQEAWFPLAAPAAEVSVMPDVVLVGDPSIGGWQTYAFSGGSWQRGTNLAAPDAVAASFTTPPVAVGNKIAVRGNGVIHVLTIQVVELPTG